MKLDAKGWLIGVEHHASPNFNERPPETKIDLLVIHAISLPPDEFSANDVIDFFMNHYPPMKDIKVSAHFFIKRDGTIVQFVSVFDRAWHAGVSEFEGRANCNDYSIGVEMEGCDTISFTAGQYQSLIELTRFLQKQFQALRITSHAKIALPQGRKTDPGPMFDWDRYFKGV